MTQERMEDKTSMKLDEVLSATKSVAKHVEVEVVEMLTGHGSEFFTPKQGHVGRMMRHQLQTSDTARGRTRFFHALSPSTYSRMPQATADYLSQTRNHTLLFGIEEKGYIDACTAKLGLYFAGVLHPRLVVRRESRHRRQTRYGPR